VPTSHHLSYHAEWSSVQPASHLLNPYWLWPCCTSHINDGCCHPGYLGAKRALYTLWWVFWPSQSFAPSRTKRSVPNLGFGFLFVLGGMDSCEDTRCLLMAIVTSPDFFLKEWYMGDDDDKAEFMMKAFVVVFWILFGKRLDSSPDARPWNLVSVGCTQIGYPCGFLTFHHCGDSGFYLNS